VSSPHGTITFAFATFTVEKAKEAKIPLVTIVTIGNGMMVRELYSSL
jgi:hypothetical protein